MYVPSGSSARIAAMKSIQDCSRLDCTLSPIRIDFASLASFFTSAADLILGVIDSMCGCAMMVRGLELVHKCSLRKQAACRHDYVGRQLFCAPYAFAQTSLSVRVKPEAVTDAR